jgi:pectinesterase
MRLAVLFGEYNTYGPGVPRHPQRPNYTTLLTAQEATLYNITTALGSDYASWVDTAYLSP